MTKRAWIFPGQGSQYTGMGRELYDASEHAKKLFKRSEEVTDKPMRRYIFDGPGELLNNTSNTQVALVVVSLAALAYYVKRHRERPDFVSGHSVGEISALVAAGAMTEEDAILLAHERGQAMEEAGQDNPGGMAAIIGMPDQTAEQIAVTSGVTLANYNVTNQQSVISGSEEGISEASESARAHGARVVRLGVSIAAHSSLMASAADRLSRAIEQIHFRDPHTPIIANQTGQIMDKASELAASLPHQLTHPVLWAGGVDHMYELGARHFTEFGPKKVLIGLVRKQLNGRSAETQQFGDDLRGQS